MTALSGARLGVDYWLLEGRHDVRVVVVRVEAEMRV